MENEPRNFFRSTDRNHNHSEPLMYDIEYYICHDFGHKARDCKSKEFIPQKQAENWTFSNSEYQTKIWKRKQGKQNEEAFKLSLQA